MNGIPDEELKVSLPVRMSAVTSTQSGLARIHVSHLEMFGDQDHPMVFLSNGKKRVVVKIVADRLAPKDCIILRNGDMESLALKEGEIIDIEPYSRLTDELSISWKKFKDRFKNDEEESETK